MTKEELLLDICKRTATVGDYKPKIYGQCYLANTLNEKSSHIRYLLEALYKDGMLVKARSGCYMEDDGKIRYCKGWALSDKAYDSEMYQQCKKEADAEFAQWKAGFNLEWEKCTQILVEGCAIKQPFAAGLCAACRRHCTKDGQDICGGGIVRGRLGRYAEATNCKNIGLCRRFVSVNSTRRL